MLKVVKIILLLIFTLLLGIIVFMLIQKNNNPDNLPKIFGYSYAIVISDSMIPLFNSGDLVILKEENVYKIDDVVTFKTGDFYTTHRIIDINNGVITTKGDDNPKEDDLKINDSNIEGKVVKIYDGVGNVINDLLTAKGIIIIICIFAALVGTTFLIGYMKNKNQNKLY